MVDDKDVDGVLNLLPNDATYYFTKADSHRAIDENVLQQKAAQHGLTGLTFPTVYEAYKEVMRHALRNDVVFIGGSSYIVGDFLKNCL